MPAILPDVWQTVYPGELDFTQLVVFGLVNNVHVSNQMAYPVLLAAHDGVLRELFQRALASAGHSLKIAEDGRKALALVAGFDNLPFVLLADVSLPGMNEYEVANEVVRLRTAAKVGFIVGWMSHPTDEMGSLN
jgi:PleD family two-component response regulator